MMQTRLRLRRKLTNSVCQYDHSTALPPSLSSAGCTSSESVSHCSQPLPQPPTAQLTPPSSCGRRPAPLNLSQGEGNGSASTALSQFPPASGPSTAERMWTEYAANRSTSPKYFLYPPFTREQKEWIMQVGHPLRDYVLQTWQD